MPYAAVGDLRMFYDDAGASDGPPLVLLHGFTVTGQVTWGPLLPALGVRHRLIVPDLRGHGRTDNPGGPASMNLRQFARDVAGLCRELDVERAAFCGYSAGAMLQLSLALAEPRLVAASVLVSGAHRLPDQTRARMRTRTADDLAEEWFGAPEQSGRPVPPVSATWHTALGPEHWRQVLRDFLALFDHPHAADYPERDELASLTHPVLLLHGDRDEFLPVDVPVELYRALPDAELCILPGTAHEVVDLRPALVQALTLEFLERRSP